jgi:hypothetical protein
MVKIEVGKRYTACPLFADVHEERCKVAKKQKMTGPCIFTSPRIVTLAFANGIRESFRPDEVK